MDDARTHPDHPRFLNSNGYLVCIVDGRARPHHRIVWESINGPIPPGYEVHHQDGDKLNNDPANLVIVPRAEHRRHHCLERIDRIREQVRQQPRDPRGRFVMTHDR